MIAKRTSAPVRAREAVAVYPGDVVPQSWPASPGSPDATDSTLARGWRRARAAHRNLALPLEAFAADVQDLIRRGRARLGLPFDATVLRAEIGRLHFEDLYLARLCERGDEQAWRNLVARYQPDLESVLRRECSAADAEAVAAEVLSEAASPTKRAGARTQLGTYEGAGPLWAWFATIGIRKARRRRKAREVSLADTDVVDDVQPASTSDEEDVDRFAHALRDAWSQLDDQERLALTWKHRDRLAQRAIARLLGVSEPTVSRLVARAVAKIRGSVAGSTPPTAGTWTRLEQVLSAHLERSPTERPPKVKP